MFPTPYDLVPLFHCPLCSPSAFLVAPTTLRCGHTVCSSHITSSTCPIPSCSTAQSQGFAPNIPSSSRVAFYPAPSDSDEDTAPQLLQHRVDVRVNNIVDLLNNAMKDTEEQPDDFVGTYEDSDTDSDSGHTCQAEASASNTRPPSPTSSQRPASPSSPRPRKRHRKQLDTPSTDLPSASTAPHVPPHSNTVDDFEKTLATELTCEICFMLLNQPVTTPCQHTFCSKCLQRSLDHSMLCPLCRESLPGFAFFQEHPLNKIILSLLLKAYPDSYASRAEALQREERDARLDTPIFVCQLSFPGMPTILHFFEPRYRLMLRRCLEQPSPTFGMIMPPRAAPIPGHGTNAGSDFGTMLEIKNVQMLPDGRSMVQTWGTHRFRILERGSLDGYMIGRVERVDDYEDDLADWATQDESATSSTSYPGSDSLLPPSPHSFLTHIASGVSAPSSPTTATTSSLSTSCRPTSQSVSTPALLATCHAFLRQLRAGTAPWVVQRFNHTYGSQPPDTDPGAFSFWMCMVLPIDEHEKAKLLPVKSARLRLRMVVGWIEQLNSNWWFSSGCIVL
ncbi:hypothetical protein HYDPIDRAFT_105286 [Hydnomerulius pinastri MD-312]|nr:hypothetical protein HYDPIDRAFT_105286 [Hydnomerulius pinastri MD-312]